MMLPGLLVTICLLTGSQAPEIGPAGPANEVVVVDWRRFDSARPLSDQTLTVAKLLDTSLRYNLAWAQSTECSNNVHIAVSRRT